MTSLTDTQVITASGGLVELGYAEVSSTHNITSTSQSNTTPFIGPVTVVSDGSPLLIEFQSPASSVGSNQTLYVNLVVDGAITGIIAQSHDTSGPQNVPIRASRRVTLSAGSHTIALSAWATSSSGTSVQAGAGGVGAFHEMQLRVSKIVEATQWPAVTTGTIICTSSTRPASPFEGQKIYETDTDRELTYDSSAWVQTNSLGGWSTWTPQLYQNGNLTSTINHARYTRIGDTAIVQGKVSATQAGTAGQQIEIRNLPYALEAAGDYTVTGNGVYWDGSLRWLLHTESLPTATATAFGYDSAPFAAYGGGRFGSSPSKAVASGHFVSFALTYEIA